MNRALAVFVVLFLCGVAAVYTLSQDNPVTPSADQQENTTQDKVVSGGEYARIQESDVDWANDPSPELTESQISQFFKEKFATRFDNPYWQLKLVEQLMQLFKQLYPEDWEARLLAFIRSEFPDIAEVLIAKLYGFIEYMDWLKSLEGNVDFVDKQDRLRAMWDKRVALFGDEAYEIWEAAYKDEQFAERLKDIETSYAPFSQKVTDFKQIFTDVHGVDVASDRQKHKTQIMTRFLSLENVQSDLQSMDASTRTTELRAFREAMGLNEEALTRWDALDAERDTQWDSGTNYMEERQKLVDSLSGDALDTAIKALQVQLFGETEAQFIANEEASGFYRFNQQRIYGVN